MGFAKKLLFMAALVLLPNTVAAQIPIIKTFDRIPSPDLKVADDAQISAWRGFSADHSDWTLVWGKTTGVPSGLFGTPIRIGGTNLVDVASSFLDTVKEMYSDSDFISNLVYLETRETSKTRHITFQQYYDGTPVEGGLITVHMTLSNDVYMLTSDYSAIKTISNSPDIRMDNAEYNALKELDNNYSMNDFNHTANLVILPYANIYKYVWKVVIEDKRMIGQWIIYVDAGTGDVLSGHNMMKYDSLSSNNPDYNYPGNIPEILSMTSLRDNNILKHDIGYGSVYEHNPDVGDTVGVALINLYYPGTVLQGPYLEVYNDDGPEAYNENRVFKYGSTNTHFDEVMAWYHAENRFRYEYLNNLGYSEYSELVKIFVHVGTGWGNSIVFWSGIMWVGDGDGQTRYDLAHDCEVFYHEYQHLVTKDLTYDGLVGNEDEEDAMSEAFSDYFACSCVDSQAFEDYAYVGPGALRELDNSYVRSNWDPVYGPLYTYHQASQIFSGALWDIREALGASTADEIIFEGLSNLSQSAPDFEDGKAAILAADYAINGGVNIDVIDEAFCDHGITEPPYDTPDAPTITMALWEDPGIPRIQVRWTRNPAEEVVSRYELQRKVGEGSFSLKAYEAEPTSSPIIYLDDNIKEYQQNWTYRVRAENIYGWGSWSGEVTAYWENEGGDDEKELLAVLSESAPDSLVLDPNYPNPFNPITQIRFGLSEPSHVRLQVLNTRGQQVRTILDEDRPKGWHTVMWDGKDAYGQDAASGIYFYVLEAQGKRLLKKMVLVR